MNLNSNIITNFRPNQKSPIPLDRYQDSIDAVPVVSPVSTLNKEKSYKFVARALYNFTPQNHRELGFRKGDLIYVKRQVDANWYEGERNAAVGIFPVSYAEIIPQHEVDTLK